jgi:hypothetical protein
MMRILRPIFGGNFMEGREKEKAGAFAIKLSFFLTL